MTLMFYPILASPHWPWPWHHCFKDEVNGEVIESDEIHYLNFLHDLISLHLWLLVLLLVFFKLTCLDSFHCNILSVIIEHDTLISRPRSLWRWLWGFNRFYLLIDLDLDIIFPIFPIRSASIVIFFRLFLKMTFQVKLIENVILKFRPSLALQDFPSQALNASAPFFLLISSSKGL